MKAPRRTVRLSRKHERLELPADARVRFGVVADTHSQPHPRTFEVLAALRPAAILHAGDIGQLGVLDELSKIARVIAVRGNIDGYDPSTPDVFVVDLAHGDALATRVLLMHIAVNGPVLRADAVRLAREEQASLVVCGHSHVPFIGRDRGLAIFNPGSAGPRRFTLPIVVGLLEVGAGALRMSHIDCETGAPWAPPPL